MEGPVAIVIAVIVVAALLIPIIHFANRRSSAIREMLRGVAASAGWSDIASLRMRHGVQGSWRSFRATLSYIARQKSTPQRLIVTIDARSDVRLGVRRRFDGFFSNKPMTWFGPPIVEVQAPAAAPFWVRTDEVNLAERLFADSAVAAAIENTIVARFDDLRVNAKGLRIIRAIDEGIVRRKYALPRFTMGLDPGRIEPLAREEWNAAEAVANKLALM